MVFFVFFNVVIFVNFFIVRILSNLMRIKDFIEDRIFNYIKFIFKFRYVVF